jgi:sulfite exporter TauE/SafE
MGLDRLGHGIGWADLGALLAGSVMVVWGALLWPRPAPGFVPLRRTARHRPRPWSWLESRFVALARSARQRPPLLRASLLGLSSALLPCGWLYAFVVLAAGTGSAARGALLLAAFWSGTLPALLGLGLGVQRWTQRWRAQLPRLSALLLLSLGAYNLATRWPAALTSPANAADTSAPSCHHAAL